MNGLETSLPIRYASSITTTDATYEALDEAMNAAAWYETRQEELARRFLNKWEETENRVAADPAINRTFSGEFRRCRFDVFAYRSFTVSPRETPSRSSR